uniref:Thioesterase domain-containing protein n=2 Tax=Triticum urartu TaxID=4572 RepID=A0A8R7TQK3_TRIUA
MSLHTPHEIKQYNSIFTMQQSPNNVAPNTKHPTPSLVRAGARANWFRSGHLAMISGQSRRTRRVKALAVPASGSRDVCSDNISQEIKPSSIRADKFFQVEMTVRDNDLDQYGVVNNAIYVAYIHNAREELAASIGFSMASVARTGNAMALLELNLKYFKPLLRGAKFVVKVRVVQIKGARILVEHFIETLPDHELILEATATVVCLNKDYRPTRVFPEMSSKLQQFFSTRDG